MKEVGYEAIKINKPKKKFLLNRLPRKAKIAGLAAAVLSTVAPCFNHSLLTAIAGQNTTRNVQNNIPTWQGKMIFENARTIIAGGIRYKENYYSLDLRFQGNNLGLYISRATKTYSPYDERRYHRYFEEQIPLP
jgi:hypothetical protein